MLKKSPGVWTQSTERIFLLVMIAIMIFSVGLEPASLCAAESSFWRSDYQSALSDAKAQKKLLLLHFYADWCMPCKRMDRETLYSSELTNQFGDKVIAVKINGEHHPDLMQKFGVQSYPTDVFVTPEERIESTSSNFMPINDYLKLVSKVESNFSRIQWIQRMREKAEEEKTLKVEVAEEKQIFKLVDVEQTPLALDGYCPVTLENDKSWVKGTEEFAYEHKGFRYFFTSAEQLASFKKYPDKYSPRLLGCDPVEMWEKDKAIYGTTRFGAYYNGDLYLFASDFNRQIFKENPVKYTHTRHVQRIDEIEISMLK